MHGKCRLRMPVMHFTPSTVSCRAYPTTSMRSCSHSTSCCTWHCTWLSTSGQCRSTTATLKCRRYCSRLSMALHTTLTITCSTHATTASISLCGIVSVAPSTTRVGLKDVDHSTTSRSWNPKSRRIKSTSCYGLNVRLLLKHLYLSASSLALFSKSSVLIIPLLNLLLFISLQRVVECTIC